MPKGDPEEKPGYCCASGFTVIPQGCALCAQVATMKTHSAIQA